MHVTTELIDHLAALSKLSFNEQEKAEIRTDLERMLQMVSKLQEVDTTGVQPLTHMTTNRDVLREDEVITTITREEGLKNAATKNADHFLVPKVIKKQQ